MTDQPGLTAASFLSAIIYVLGEPASHRACRALVDGGHFASDAIPGDEPLSLEAGAASLTVTLTPSWLHDRWGEDLAMSLQGAVVHSGAGELTLSAADAMVYPLTAPIARETFAELVMRFLAIGVAGGELEGPAVVVSEAGGRTWATVTTSHPEIGAHATLSYGAASDPGSYRLSLVTDAGTIARVGRAAAILASPQPPGSEAHELQVRVAEMQAAFSTSH